MDPRNVPNKMLGGYKTPTPSVDIRPLLAKLKEVEAMARHYQTGTPARVNFAPIINKVREAALIGAELQRKASSGKL